MPGGGDCWLHRQNPLEEEQVMGEAAVDNPRQKPSYGISVTPLPGLDQHLLSVCFAFFLGGGFFRHGLCHLDWPWFCDTFILDPSLNAGISGQPLDIQDRAFC